MKKIILSAALMSAASAAYSGDFSALLYNGMANVKDAGVKYVKWETTSNVTQGFKWTFDDIGGGYYNIRSSIRPAACIYDSSGSIRAKMDSSCNKNYPRAEWQLVPAGNVQYKINGILFTFTGYNIRNKIGRCLEANSFVSGNPDVKAIDCNGSPKQLFYVNKQN